MTYKDEIPVPNRSDTWGYHACLQPGKAFKTSDHAIQQENAKGGTCCCISRVLKLEIALILFELEGGLAG